MTSSRFIKALLVVFYLFCGLTQAAGSGAPEAKELLNLKQPIWGLSFLSDSELLLTTKNGKIYWSDLKGKPKEIKHFIPAIEVGQGGLMDVRVRKEREKTWVYFTSAVAAKSKGKQTTALFRAEWKSGNPGELTSFAEIFRAIPDVDSGYHFGSRVTFDDQGMLYMSLGERNERDRAQDLGQHWGKVIRLRPDGSVPEDNPWSGKNSKAGALAEIFTWGHRNPQGIAFDPESKQVIVSEHGPRGGDELNVLIAGANYGWPIITYGREYWGPRIGEPRKEGLEQPLIYFVPSIAPSSLLIHSGVGRPEWRGIAFQGALRLTHLSRVEMKRASEPRKWKASELPRWFENLGERVRSLAESPRGDLYFGTDSGKLYRVQPNLQPGASEK